MSININISSILKDGLAKLSMYNDNMPSDGLKFVANIGTETNNYIKLHLLDAEKHGAIAVYFKYFDNNRPPIPQIYIYEQNELDKRLEKDKKIFSSLYKELWSSCKVPMFFIFSNTHIEIFNSLSKNDTYSEEIKPFKTLEIISIASGVKNELQNFQAKMFDTGEFWNTSLAKKEFSYAKSAYNSLLNSLQIARNELINKQEKSINIINSLLIKSILIRYMEARGVFKNFWNKFSKDATSFKDICHDDKLIIDVLDDLSSHFNGGIFKLQDYEKSEIKNINLTKFKYFIQGNVSLKEDTNKHQMHFWDLYSFKDLPIELISNIYELFLKEDSKKGVVYTPPILVDFLIDEMMPLSDYKPNFKVIDPACGSGIFLVGAYRRLIQWWMINNNFDKPSSDKLKSIVKNQIYGIDKEHEAVEVAKFSLSLAICDTLSPEAIWDELHFDNFTETGNLIAMDFFKVLNDEDINKKYLKKFDLVIGNPPFVSELGTIDAKLIEQEMTKHRPSLPDNQLAFLFLEQSFKLCKKDHYVCMVQPSAFLYNNNVEDFRKYFLNTFDTKQIVDFSGLNTTLFKRQGKKNGADVPTCVVFTQNRKPNINEIELLHITVRQTFESNEKIYFDLSYYDYHWQDYHTAINNKYIWKCNLLGGSRVVDIVNRLNSYPKLKEYLENKQKNHKWYIAEGFQLNGKDKYKEGHTADYITGQPTMPATAFNEDGIENSKIYIMEETNFHRIRLKNKKIFEPPHLLIKEKIGRNKIVSEYRKDYLTFQDDTIGIHAPKSDEQDLLLLEKRLQENSLLYIFHLASSSAQAGISKATKILKNDIESLPYPTKNMQSFNLSTVETYFANDTLNYMFDWIKGAKSLPIFDSVTPNQIKEYQDVYCELLKTVYKSLKHLITLETNQFIITSFYSGEKPSDYLYESDKLDTDLENLINQKTGKNINIKRVLKLYDENVIYIIKPKQYRFWMKSIAVKDADDTFTDIIDMRYQ